MMVGMKDLKLGRVYRAHSQLGLFPQPETQGSFCGQINSDELFLVVGVIGRIESPVYTEGLQSFQVIGPRTIGWLVFVIGSNVAQFTEVPVL